MNKFWSVSHPCNSHVAFLIKFTPNVNAYVTAALQLKRHIQRIGLYALSLEKNIAQYRRWEARLHAGPSLPKDEGQLNSNSNGTDTAYSLHKLLTIFRHLTCEMCQKISKEITLVGHTVNKLKLVSSERYLCLPSVMGSAFTSLCVQ